MRFRNVAVSSRFIPRRRAIALVAVPLAACAVTLSPSAANADSTAPVVALAPSAYPDLAAAHYDLRPSGDDGSAREGVYLANATSTDYQKVNHKDEATIRAAQEFRQVSHGDGTVSFQQESADGSGPKCLALYGEGGEGTAGPLESPWLYSAPCTGGANQGFKLEPTGDGLVKIFNVGFNQCLRVEANPDPTASRFGGIYSGTCRDEAGFKWDLKQTGA
ncbi:RICIN domain-containing protein [Streptomyces lydicamycinicus]|uniref:RICIN domain-containing protein n=1 Tax=Streptomyces lydicamycinicus TaxID=1546107 RepID=UPI0020365783|nr:RICIN domain-containing protein [Streptomyces lydicamycinicus]USA00536.1 RICIN domain-containing protein [Streptomyces lydicamycinicus]